MSLRTYEEVRPWARAIKQRTGLGPHAGVMPPWYVEKNIGIQKFKNDPSLSADEIAMIAKWADSGAPRGKLADMPPLRTWTATNTWSIGEPDLVVRTKDVVVKGTAPDWWGEIPRVPTGLTEDRYVSALEIREVNDVDRRRHRPRNGRRPIRVPSHDLEHARARRGDAAIRSCPTTARRGRCTKWDAKRTSSIPSRRAC